MRYNTLWILTYTFIPAKDSQCFQWSKITQNIRVVQSQVALINCNLDNDFLNLLWFCSWILVLTALFFWLSHLFTMSMFHSSTTSVLVYYGVTILIMKFVSVYFQWNQICHHLLMLWIHQPIILKG